MSWRTLLAGWCAIAVACALLGAATSMPAVVPPLIAAAVVLLIAALATDYFGFRRRATPWRGQIAASPMARARIATLEARFATRREAGAVDTAAHARALLVGLVEVGAWSRAVPVVDFLAADALMRATSDPVCDALIGLVLVETGQLADARRTLDRVGARTSVAIWARARLLEREGKLVDALATLGAAVDDRAVVDAPRRDLAIDRARLLVKSGARDHARVQLAALVRAGWRREVEALMDRGEPALGHVVQEALGLLSIYRAA